MDLVLMRLCLCAVYANVMLHERAHLPIYLFMSVLLGLSIYLSVYVSVMAWFEDLSCVRACVCVYLPVSVGSSCKTELFYLLVWARVSISQLVLDVLIRLSYLYFFTFICLFSTFHYTSLISHTLSYLSIFLSIHQPSITSISICLFIPSVY